MKKLLCKVLRLQMGDEVILTDDASADKTALVSESLAIKTFIHQKNKGYESIRKNLLNRVSQAVCRK